MQKKILAIIALVLFGSSNSQLQAPGPCPGGVEVQSDFDLQAYMGTWYEYAKYPVFFERGDRCVKGELSLKEDGDVRVVNSGIRPDTNLLSSIEGYAIVAEPAKLKIIFPVSRPNNETSNYWVLSTDYTNYSVVSNCRPVANNLHNTTAWILSRQRTLAPHYIKKAEKVFIKNGLSLNELVVTNQENC